VLSRTALREANVRFQFLIDAFVDALITADLDVISGSGFGFSYSIECPNEGRNWRDMEIDLENTEFRLLNRSGIHSGGIGITAEIDVLVRCRYTLQAGALGILRTVCSNSLLLLRYKGPLEVDINMDFDPATAKFSVTPDVRVWSDWDDIQPTCLDGTISNVLQALRVVNVDLKARAEAKITAGLEASIVRKLVFPAAHQPFTNMFLEYRVNSMRFFEDYYIEMSASGNVSALLDDGTRVFHEFGGPDSGQPLLGPPNDWAQVMADQKKTPVLFGLRMSTDLLSAISNVTRMLFVAYDGNASLANSTVLYNVSLSAPVFFVNSNGNLSAVVASGYAEAECDTEPNKGKSMLDLQFARLNASVSVLYTGRDRAIADAKRRIQALYDKQKIPMLREPTADEVHVGIVLRFENLTFDDARFELKAPPVPFDARVLNNIVQAGINSQRNNLNDLLAQRPISLTPDLAQYFPYPTVRVAELDRGRGFFESTTSCVCGAGAAIVDANGDRAVDACTFRCATTDIAVASPATTAPPLTAAPMTTTTTQQRRRAADAGHVADCAPPAPAPRLAKRQTPASGNATKLFVLQTYNNENCRMDLLGHTAQILELRDTGGACVELPTLLSAFSNVRGTFYSLSTRQRMNDAGAMETVASIDLACERMCAGTCTAVLPSLKLQPASCQKAGASTRESFVLQAWAMNTCIGGNLWQSSDDSPVTAVLQGWKTKEAPPTLCPSYVAEPRVDRDALAAPDFIVSFGHRAKQAELNNCANINPNGAVGADPNSFAQVRFDDAGVKSYAVGCRRSDGTAGAAMNQTTCVQCARQFGAVAYDACVTPSNQLESSGGLLLGVPFFKALRLRTCNFDDPDYVTLPPITTASVRTLPPTTAFELPGGVTPVVLGLSVGVPLGVCLLVILVALCIGCGWASHLRSFYGAHRWSFGAPPPGRRYLFIFLAFGAFISVIQAAVWTLSEAIAQVDEGFFSERLGVDDRFVHPNVFAGRMRLWRDSGAVILCFNALLAILLLVDGVLVRSRKDGEQVEGNPMYAIDDVGRAAALEAERQQREQRKQARKVGLRVRRYIWFAMIVLQTFVFLVCPLFVAYEMFGTIKVTPLDSTIIESIKDPLETMLNAIGAVYVFDIIMQFFVATWQLLPAGAMFGTVIFLADMGSSVGTGSTLISRGLWVTAAAINVTLHFVAPIALCPAVLISLHRYNIDRAWWVALVWIALWLGGIVLVYLAMFRNIALADDPGQLLVRPHRFMFGYMFVTIVCTFLLVIADFLYTTSTNLFAFFLFYRLTIFFFTACYVRVWLEAYRPKWSMSIIHEAAEHTEKANLEREATLRREKIAENSNRRERARNAAFLHFEADEDAESMLKNETRWDKAMAKLSACCGCCVKYTLVPLAAPIAALSYGIEYGRPATNSLPRRRTWLALGGFFGLIMALEAIYKVSKFDSKQDTVDFVNGAEERLLFGFRWPEGDAGNIFDAAFDLHTALTKAKVAFVFLCIIAVIAMCTDDCISQRRGQPALQRSVERQTFVGIGITMVLFVAALAPSTPDYLQVASFGESLPQCGDEFNATIRKFYGGAIGLVLTIVTTKGLIAILLIMLASSMRGTRMIIVAALHALHPAHHDEHEHEHRGCVKYMKWKPPEGPLPPAVIDHAMVIYQLSAIVNPLVVGTPMLFFFLFDSGPLLVALYLVNWIVTAAVAGVLSPKFIDVSYFGAVWAVFFATLLAIIFVKLDQYDLLDPSKIVKAMGEWSTYSTMIFVLAEICIANVIVSDIVYYIIWALYPDYSVVASARHVAKGDKLDNLDTDFAPKTLRGLNSSVAPTLRSGNSSLTSSVAPTLRGIASVAPTTRSPDSYDFVPPAPASSGATLPRAPPASAATTGATLRTPPANTASGVFSTTGSGTLARTPNTQSAAFSTETMQFGRDGAPAGGQGGDCVCPTCGNRYATLEDVAIHEAKRHGKAPAV
jgi:hypothetical protein